MERCSVVRGVTIGLVIMAPVVLLLALAESVWSLVPSSLVALVAVFLAGFRSVNLAILLDANLDERMAPPDRRMRHGGRPR